MIDVSRARADTPGCEGIVHFNNAGASLMPDPVLNATVEHLRLEARIGGYEAAAKAWAALEGVYDSAARLLGCDRAEIAVIENATRAWDMAFYSIPFRAGDRILTASAEYASNYIAFLQMARRAGVEVQVIPNDASGQLDVAALRDTVDERARLIAISHVPTNGGLVNPAEEVGQIAREAGILYLLDACQSVGQMPIDVRRIGCDFLSATSRKYLRGPRGCGLLYVRNEVLDLLEPPFLDLHAAEWVARDRYVVRDDARKFETWETNWAGKIGMGVAIDYAMAWTLESIWERVIGLAGALRARLDDIPGVVVRDIGSLQCGIVTFTVDGASASDVQRTLSELGVNVAVSPRRFTRIDMDARELDAVVRASVHYYNTEEEVDRFLELLASIVAKAG